METALQLTTTVLPGGRIEVQSPDLPEGRTATVLVTVEEAVGEPKRRVSEIMAEHPGTRLFHSAEEVDACIREERESWERECDRLSGEEKSAGGCGITEYEERWRWRRACN